jgi:deazaflavin-dependent oxidoreductase (nitroreductase family)
MSERKLTLFEQFILRVENIIMTHLVPPNHPGPVFKWLFKTPVIFYKLGLPLFGDFILLLTTTGRKSGKLRYTPVEYRCEPGTGDFIIMAGWGGKTDWRKNIEANPHVLVQAGRQKFNAVAERLTDREVADWLAETVGVNPRSADIWSRWAGEPVTLDRPESFLQAARYFPSFRLRKRENGQ